MKFSTRINPFISFGAVALLVAFALPAHAVNFGDTTNNAGGDGGNANSTATANAGAIAGAAAGAAVVGSGNSNVTTSTSTTQGQLQGQINGNANNDQSVTVQGDTTITKIPRQTATAWAAPINPTAICMGGASGGAQGPGIGLSFGKSYESTNCMILETARSFEQAGYADDALAIRCTTKYAEAAPSCVALADAKAAKVAAKQSAIKDAHNIESPKAEAGVEQAVAVKSLPQPVYSENGYYSTVTNPLAQ